MKIVTVCEEGRNVSCDFIIKLLNRKFDEIKKNNPRGFMDEFEQRIGVLCQEIAQDLDCVFFQNDEGEFVFDFTTGGIGTAKERKEYESRKA